MQVLVLAVQSTVELRDLGAATSSASFFRSIGGSVGVSVFAALFNSSLSDHLASELPKNSGVSPSALRGSPAELARLPAAVHDAYVHSFVQSLAVGLSRRDFLCCCWVFHQPAAAQRAAARDDRR